MDDKQAIEALYKQMYRAMIAKDTATLNLVHDDEFGSDRHTWQLQLRFQLVKHDGSRLFTAACA
ncbi:MAG: hypothetical protein IJU33_07075 [Bacteroidales bacterium]|nr:hypothetical protein [Bacteroidales bacterium]